MKIFDISENSPKQDFQKVFFTPKHYLKQYQNTLSPTPSPSAKGVCSHPTICSKKGQSNNSPFWQAKLANLAQLQIPPNARSHFSDAHAIISGKALLCHAVSDLHSKKQVS